LISKSKPTNPANTTKPNFVRNLLIPCYGASKARFFSEFGFQRENWEALVEALREHAKNSEIARTTETGFGPRYVVDGEMKAPDGRKTRIRTIWQFDRGEIAPRLITAYPCPQT